MHQKIKDCLKKAIEVEVCIGFSDERCVIRTFDNNLLQISEHHGKVVAQYWTMPEYDEHWNLINEDEQTVVGDEFSKVLLEVLKYAVMHGLKIEVPLAYQSDLEVREPKDETSAYVLGIIQDEDRFILEEYPESALEDTEPYRYSINHRGDEDHYSGINVHVDGDLVHYVLYDGGSGAGEMSGSGTRQEAEAVIRKYLGL